MGCSFCQGFYLTERAPAPEIPESQDYSAEQTDSTLVRCAKRPVTTLGLPKDYPPTRSSGQVNGLGATHGSPANARGTAEFGRSTAWGKTVCGRTACTVWEGGTGEVDARARWNTHSKGDRRD